VGGKRYATSTCGGVVVHYQNTGRSPEATTPEIKSDMNLAGRKALEVHALVQGRVMLEGGMI
jgi:hypothetical protein